MDASSQPRPKKSLGQHFLKDPGICRRIAALLQAETGEKILEIGPGPGALTQALLALNPERLLLLEKDSHWAAHWRNEGCEVVEGDALAFPWQNLADDWLLAGNLPYNVASPLIWDIVARCGGWRRAVFMTQKEVAQRICACPGSKSYGALSVWVQCHAKTQMGFVLSPGAFHPPPKVDSAVVVFQPLPMLPAHPQALNFLLKICFQQRRKQLGSILKPWPKLLAALETQGGNAHQRPENLTPEQFLAMSATAGLPSEQGSAIAATNTRQ